MMAAALLMSTPLLDGLKGSPTWRERMKAQRHIRPHVNPLQRRFVLQTLDEDALSFNAVQPLHVDIGCGKGHFCVRVPD